MASLKLLQDWQVQLGLLKLEEMGITLERWLEMIRADAATSKVLSAGWPQAGDTAKWNKLSYDVMAISRILGIPAKCKDPIPKPAEGEIIVYYGGWTLQELLLSPAGQKRMKPFWHGWEFFAQFPKAESGYYRLLLPVPHSEATLTDQLRLLISMGPSWVMAPINVVATAVLAHLVETDEFLLKGHRYRCEVPEYSRFPESHIRYSDLMTIDFYDGRMQFHRAAPPDLRVWLAAAQKVS